MNNNPTNSDRPARGGRSLVAGLAVIAGATFVIVLALGLGLQMAESLPGQLALAAVAAVFCAACVAVLRWLCCWRRFRWVLFGLACLATLLALAHAIENWRGSRAWREAQRLAAAKGERLDPAGVVPPPVPDAENFAMAPIFEGLRRELASAGRGLESDKQTAVSGADRFRLSPYRTNGSSAGVALGKWSEGRRTDLAAWQRYYRDPDRAGDGDRGDAPALRYGVGAPPAAEQPNARPARTNEFPVSPQPGTPPADVLLALSKFDPQLNELRRVAARPHSRFPLRYEDGFAAIYPELYARLRGACQLLTLRAVANLAADRSQEALADVQLAIRLAGSIRDEPFLISHLVRISMVQMALQPVWEGLTEHRWSDAQLAALDGELAKADFAADYHLAMRGERVFALWMIESLRQTRDPRVLSGQYDAPDPTAVRFFHKLLFRLAVPDGWFAQNKAAMVRTHMELVQPAADMARRVISPEKAQALEALAGKRPAGFNPYTFFVQTLLPGSSKAAQRFAFAQAATDLARVACALERHRLAHGNYPDKLDALSPAFLNGVPHDVVSGQPLKYRRDGQGRFTLYSVGWNGADDGGEMLRTAKGNLDLSKGDWVWPQPAE